MTVTGEFNDRVVLIAGGTGALGCEVSMEFLSAGAQVIVTYRGQREFVELLVRAQRADLRAPAGIVLDVTDFGAAQTALEGITQKYGRLDALVNIVGGYAGGKGVWEEDAASWQHMMALNFLSGFALSRAAVPIMIKQKRGWIVNIASRAGLVPSPLGALYGASKAAALSLFASLAAEVQGYGINVNSVVPSIIDTPANRQAMPSADFKRWPKPAEIADVVVFLCSDEARLIQGAAIPVYGGT